MDGDNLKGTATDGMPVPELSERLDMGLNQTYAALENGIIPGAFRVGRRWFIPRQAAEKKLRGE